MGATRTGKGFPGDLILDAGALIALERGGHEIKAILRGARDLGSRVVVPASALAQVWRGGPRSAVLARLTAAGEIDLLDEDRAKEIGVRLGACSASDIADAHVVCCAYAYRATIATSDSDDIRALASPGQTLTLIAV